MPPSKKTYLQAYELRSEIARQLCEHLRDAFPSGHYVATPTTNPRKLAGKLGQWWRAELAALESAILDRGRPIAPGVTGHANDISFALSALNGDFSAKELQQIGKTVDVPLVQGLLADTAALAKLLQVDALLADPATAPKARALADASLSALTAAAAKQEFEQRGDDHVNDVFTEIRTRELAGLLAEQAGAFSSDLEMGQDDDPVRYLEKAAGGLRNTLTVPKQAGAGGGHGGGRDYIFLDFDNALDGYAKADRALREATQPSSSGSNHSQKQLATLRTNRLDALRQLADLQERLITKVGEEVDAQSKQAGDWVAMAFVVSQTMQEALDVSGRPPGRRAGSFDAAKLSELAGTAAERARELREGEAEKPPATM